ncbi:MAG: hypothetical protein AAGG48_25730 [Planctomycetota bacterium]
MINRVIRNAIVALCLLHTTVVFAEESQQVAIQVLDENGKPVEGASVEARYLETIHQNGKDYTVPMDLAERQKTDKEGRCQLTLYGVSWKLAGLSAHRVEVTTDEAIAMLEDAPKDPEKRRAFERDLDDQCQRYRSSYLLLDPDFDRDQPIALQMERSVKVSGSLHVNGKPIAKAFVTIHSQKTEIDRVFTRSSPDLTDDEGKFSGYCIPGNLDQARIVVERSDGNRVLTLSDVPSTQTATGKVYRFDTQVKDYAVVARPRHP